jgi:hypothetical protein
VSVLVAAMALVFTVASFWWIQVRTGRLVSYHPRVYAGAFRPGTLRIRLPLTILNTGARTLVVTDLRLEFEDTGVQAPVISFRHSIRPGSEDTQDFAHPFAVAGRQAVSKFVEFGTDGSWLPEPETEYRFQVHALIGNTDRWKELLDMSLTTPDAASSSNYLAHPTHPHLRRSNTLPPAELG